MKKVAKLLSAALAFLLIFSAVLCVSAAPVNELVGITADVSAIGEGEKVKVTVKALADFSYTNIELDITYDPDNFTIAKTDISFEADNKSVIGDVTSTNIKSNVVKVATAMSVAEDVKKGDVILVAFFTAKDGVAATADVADVPFTLSVSKFNNSGTAVADSLTAAGNTAVTIKHQCSYTTHNEQESVAPKCEEIGFDRYYCACGRYEDREKAATGHTLTGEWLPVEGEDGWYYKTCTVCGEAVKTNIPTESSDISSTDSSSDSSAATDSSTQSQGASDTAVTSKDSVSSEKPAGTGDSSIIWIVVAVMLVAVAALALSVVLGKKKKS